MRAIIADVHPLLSGMLAKRLGEQRDIDVVAQVTTLGGLAEVSRRPEPGIDVIVLHVARLDEPVERAVHEIAEASHAGSAPHVLVVSGAESDDEVLACIRSGARGYIGNTAEFASLTLAVQLVARGGAVFGASAATRLPALAREDSNSTPPPEPDALTRLTKREREVVALLTEGQNNRSIARELFISERTVRNHLTRIFLKLGVQDRFHAALVARELLPAPAA